MEEEEEPPLSFSVITRPVRQQGNRVEIEERRKKTSYTYFVSSSFT
jgi:hypothetical protein